MLNVVVTNIKAYLN